MDLLADLVAIARKGLAADGISTLLCSESEVLLRYFTLQHRLIEHCAYSVRISGAALLHFSEQTPEVRRGFAALVRNAQSGVPLWPYQSRRILIGDNDVPYWKRKRFKNHPQHDALFNDWGIQHLHLGAQRRADGFVRRTDEVCLALFRDRSMYIVDFRAHGEWGDIELLEIVERNWPHLFDQFVLHGVLRTTGPVDVKGMRQAGITLCHTLSSGRVIAPPGGGYSTSGHSTAAVMRQDNVLRRVRALENHLRAHEQALHQAVRDQAQNSATPDLHLEHNTEGLEIIDRASRRALKLADGRRFPACVGL